MEKIKRVYENLCGITLSDKEKRGGILIFTTFKDGIERSESFGGIYGKQFKIEGFRFGENAGKVVVEIG